jgi:hypothetical protein
VAINTAINGSWLLVTVSTESLTVLGTLVAPTLVAVGPILFAVLCTYLVGAMFYLLFIVLIVYRWAFVSMLVIPRIGVYIAMLAWFITFCSMLFKLGDFCLLSGQPKTSLATRSR